MMRVILLAAAAFLILGACQTKSSISSSDTIERQKRLAEDTRTEMCRGQKPHPVGVFPDIYDEWPKEAQVYVSRNICQWAAACDRPYFEARCA